MSTAAPDFTAALVYTGHLIGRCTTKGCKHTTSAEGSIVGRGECPEHGAYTLNEVIGSYAETVKCGARCLNAVGPSCDCSCGGKNHGVGHAH